MIVCLLQISKLQQAVFFAVSHLAEGQVLKGGLTQIKEGVGGSEWGTRRPITPMENVQDFGYERH